MNIELANRTATIPADAPEYVKKRIELRRAGKRKRTTKKATPAPVAVDAATDDELIEAKLAVLKASLEK
jgi:hypothetical protein